MSFSSNFPTIAPSLNLDFANTKALDPRITLTRASTATFYDGLTVAKAEENLLLQSQTFENASWVVTNSAITANTSVAPDGTNTAETITASAGTGQHLVRQDTSTVGMLTVSVFAKAGTHNFLQIFHGNSANYFADFDLSGGIVGTTGASTTASIVSIGSGWYRCVITFTTAANSAIRFAIVSSSSAVYNESWTAVGTETILLWGAQLEQRSAVTAYTATTTQPITNYIPVLRTAAAGVARYDHNPTTGESLGLLIEEQRANSLTYSEDFSNAAWTKTAATITSNAAIAPDGTLTADRTVENTALGVRYVQAPLTAFTSGVAYTLSCYFKAAGRSIVALYFETAAFPDAGRTAWFNLATQAVQAESGVTASITDVGNGWLRCSITATADATTSARPSIAILTSMGAFTNYTGDGWSGVFIWGAQLEAGAFPTSYIPTVASSVTRSADNATITGTNFSSWYRADEGAMYAEAIGLANFSDARVVFEIGDGTLNNRYNIQRNGSTNSASGVVVTSGAVQAAISVSPGFVPNVSSKCIFAYVVNNFAASMDGSAASTDLSGLVPVVDRLAFGATTTGLARWNGTIKKIAYYPLRLTNAQLQALTS